MRSISTKLAHQPRVLCREEGWLAHLVTQDRCGCGGSVRACHQVGARAWHVHGVCMARAGLLTTTRSASTCSMRSGSVGCG